jgi:hypothetical protein
MALIVFYLMLTHNSRVVKLRQLQIIAAPVTSKRPETVPVSGGCKAIITGLASNRDDQSNVTNIHG